MLPSTLPLTAYAGAAIWFWDIQYYAPGNFPVRMPAKPVVIRGFLQSLLTNSRITDYFNYITTTSCPVFSNTSYSIYVTQ
jgi:hypothetical protein